MNNCTHQQWVYRQPYLPEGFAEEDWVDPSGYEWTYREISTGRFQCWQCKEMFYYTGHWKKYYEEGIECFGSDRIVEYNAPLERKK